MGGEAEAAATEVAGTNGKRLYPMTGTTLGEAPVVQQNPEEVDAGVGQKRPCDEALGEEGEGGTMFKMPRLEEMESSAQYQIPPEAGEEDVSDDEGHVSGHRNGIASGRWSDEEHQRFLQGMEKYGRAWRIISKRTVKTRTAEQVRIHAQKYFYKQAKKAGKNKPTQDGHWTNEEHEVFLELYDKYGRSWKKISEVMKTRSNEQVRTHAQKYFSKLEELRDRGYQGRYNMDGKRHLTKSFLLNGPLSPDTPTAAMMMVNPAAVVRLTAGAPTTGPAKSPAAGTGKSGKRTARHGSDDEEPDYDPSLESDKRRSSSLSESRTMTYTSRSGRQVTTRKWDEELLGDDDDEDDEEEPGEQDHDAMVQLMRGNRGIPPTLLSPSGAAAMMVMPPPGGPAALMMGGMGMGGPLGMPPAMPLVPPPPPAATPQPAGPAAHTQGEEEDDVIYSEDEEEEDGAAQDDKAAETLLFWQQSQASGQESNDGSLPPHAAPPLPPSDTSMAQALAGSPEPHTNMLTSTAPVEMLATHDDHPPPTSEYPGALLMLQPPPAPEEEAPPLVPPPPQPEPPTVLVLPPAAPPPVPVPDPTPEERARSVMVVQQPLPLPPPPLEVEQPDTPLATPANEPLPPPEGVQGMGSLDSPSSVHEMESAQALLSWQG